MENVSVVINIAGISLPLTAESDGINKAGGILAASLSRLGFADDRTLWTGLIGGLLILPSFADMHVLERELWQLGTTLCSASEPFPIAMRNDGNRRSFLFGLRSNTRPIELAVFDGPPERMVLNLPSGVLTATGHFSL